MVDFAELTLEGTSGEFDLERDICGFGMDAVLACGDVLFLLFVVKYILFELWQWFE